MLLPLAAKARIPLIFAKSGESSSYLSTVLTDIIGEPVNRFTGTVDPNRVYFSRTVKDFNISRRALFDAFETGGSSLITLDSDESFPGAVEVGQVATPIHLLEKAIDEAHGNPKVLLLAVKGCTVVETINILKMTQVRDGKLDLEGVSKMRRDLVQPSQGLTVIDTKDELYVPIAPLAEWEARERPFFLHDDRRLAPRGVLFKGPPGTGKTSAAKWVCQSWGIPLFRLDVGAAKDKYVGNSERFLQEAIFRVEQAAPCGLLLDEVEKMLSENDSVSMSMASYLLWWLQEHRSQVITFMTCNNAEKLRPELYREGRLDTSIEFPHLYSMTSVVEFAKVVFKSYGMEPPLDVLAMATKLKTNANEVWSHAKVIEMVKRRVKDFMLKNLTPAAK